MGVMEGGVNYLWTESGIKCLENIYKSIKEVGGRIPMIHLIMEENPGSFTMTDRAIARNKYNTSLRVKHHRSKHLQSPVIWNRDDMDFLMSNWGRIKPRNMAKILNRDVRAVQKKHERLLKRIV